MEQLAGTRKQRLDSIVTHCTYGIPNGGATGIRSQSKSMQAQRK